MSTDQVLKDLSLLEGCWTTEATHPDFPDSISILGFADRERVDETPGREAARAGNPQLQMHYYDSRGVSRIYQASIDQEAWRWEMLAPGFSQRFIGSFADAGETIVGQSK